MTKTLIKGGIIVSDGRSLKGDLLLDDGIISAVAERGATAEECEVIDASGCYVLPGIIDTHVHFREPGLTDKADIYRHLLSRHAQHRSSDDYP